MKKGLFITFEGPDGSGKTTQAQKLYKYLGHKGYSVIRTREPGGTKLSEQLRLILLSPSNRISSTAELFLYEAIRAQHIQELINPSLKEGKIIICERFSDATFAYQGYGRKIDMNMIKSLDDFATYTSDGADKILPDVTFLLDISPKMGLSRVVSTKKGNKQRSLDRIEQENLKFHNRVKAGYLKLAQKYPQRIKVISAEDPKTEIHKKIIEYVEQIIKKKRIKTNHERKKRNHR